MGAAPLPCSGRKLARERAYVTRRASEALFDPFDNANVALAGLAERLERSLIVGAVVRGDGLLDAVELDQDGALRDALLVGLRRDASREKAAAVFDDCGPTELGIGGKRVRI